METIFKKGDKVFHYHYGWGTIKSISHNLADDYPLTINFGKQGNFCFTNDGRELYCEKPSLSFTEYTLEGFSQQRPEPLPKRGDVVWVRDFEDDNWEIMHFLKYDVNVSLPYIVSEDMTIRNSDNYKFLTTKNPYANEQ